MFPRVLIVGPQFDSHSGSGVTLSCLFGEWPREQLCMVASSPASHESLRRACGFYYVGQDVRWPWPFSRAGTKSRAASVGLADSSNEQVPRASRLQSARRLLAPALERASWRIADGLLEWAASLSPEVVYVQAGSFATCRFGYRLATALGIPVAVHQMDDWLWASGRTVRGSGLMQAATDGEFRRLVALAAARFAISDGMAREYRKRYGGNWEVFHNGVDIGSWTRTPREADGRPVPFRLRYGGRIGWGIGSSLMLCARAVAALRSEGLEMWLDVYTPDLGDRPCRQLAAVPGTSVHKPVPCEELQASMAAAGGQLIAYCFDEGTKGRAGLSMPTKVSECLASLRPITIVAPAELTVSREAVAGGWAHVISEPSVEAIAEGLRRIAMDSGYRGQLVTRAWTECLQSHDMAAIQHRFASALSRCAQHR